MSSISVIIPAYNHLEDVLTCLTSLQQFASRQIAIEFIVADDCSPDVMFPALLPACAAKVVRRNINGGFPANCNTGAMVAEGDILFFVNQDVFAVGLDMWEKPFSVNWDLALVEAFNDPSIGIVGAKLVFPDGKIQSAGGLYDTRKQPFHRCLGYGDHCFVEVNTPETVSWVTGAALGIRRDIFAQVSGFDEEYARGYFEDVDLCEKVKALGLSVWYEPRLQLVHKVGQTGGNPLFMTNATRFYDRWVKTGTIQADTYQLKERWW